MSDLLFATKEGKYKAIVDEIKERYKTGQPVLVGTIAVETSELISEKLKKAHIPHEVLNAKNNAREAVSQITILGVEPRVQLDVAGRSENFWLTQRLPTLS